MQLFSAIYSPVRDDIFPRLKAGGNLDVVDDVTATIVVIARRVFLRRGIERVRPPHGSFGGGPYSQGCQMAKFDPFLSLDCARVEGVGAQSKERKGSNFAV